MEHRSHFHYSVSLLAVVLVVLALHLLPGSTFLAVARAQDTDDTAAGNAAERTWTAMLYLNGDNDLCGSYPRLIERMESELGDKIGPQGFLTIVVLFDGSTTDCAQTTTTRFVVQPDGHYQAGINWWDMGELNMGDPQTLSDFGTWAMQNYPAEHYYLSLDSHGTGISGMAQDYTSARDGLTHEEIRTALHTMTQGGQQKLDVLGYEACLMGLYETAYDVRDFTDYVFFFPTVTYTNRVSYAGYMGDPRFTAATSGQEFAILMFDTYYTSVTSTYAVALVDTSQMDAVQSAVDAWAHELSATEASNRPALSSARHAAQKIDTDNDRALTDNDQHLDLWHLADSTAAQGVAVSQSAAVKAAVEAAVVRSGQRSSTTRDYRNTHGLAIYWPVSTDGWYRAYTNDQVYTATSDGAWDEFLQVYNEQAEYSTESFPTGAAHAIYLPTITR